MKNLPATIKISISLLLLLPFLNGSKSSAATCTQWDCKYHGLVEYCQGNTYCCANANACPSDSCPYMTELCRKYQGLDTDESPWTWYEEDGVSRCRYGSYPSNVFECAAGCAACYGPGSGGGSPVPQGTVYGTIYVNDGLTENGVNHSVGPSTTGCSIYDQNNVSVSLSSGNIIDGWSCTQYGSKYSTTHLWNEGDKPTLTVGGFDTSKFDCDIWYYKICHDDACTTYDENQGNGCTATFANGLEDGPKNILNFRLKPKFTVVFRTPTFMIPTNRDYVFNDWGYVYSAGTYSGGAHLSWLKMYQNSITFGTGWASLGDPTQINCSDARCDGTVTWRLGGVSRPNGEKLVVAINGATATNPQYFCTGNPYTLSGMLDCDTDHGDDASYVDSAQVCLFDCPRSSGAALDTIQMLNPASGIQIPGSTSAELTWMPVTYGNFAVACGTTQTNFLTLKWGTTNPPLNSIIVTDSNGSYTLNGLSPNTTYYWKLEARNLPNLAGGQPAVANCTDSPVRSFRTGLEQPSTGWFTAYNGDVYGYGVDMNGPVSGAPTTAWSPAALAKLNASFFSGRTALFNPSTMLSAVDPSSNKWGINTPFKVPASTTKTWLDSLDSVSAPDISDTDHVGVINNSLLGLNPSKVYVLSADGENYINSGCPDDPKGCEYSFAGTGKGVVVIYYVRPGSGSSLNIIKPFMNTIGDPNQRILFISRNNFNVSSSVITDPVSPSTAIRPTMELGIITSGTINFNGTTPAGNDKTIKVEGPLLARGVTFNRVTQYNSTPGVAVMYNAIYLSKLHELARSEYASLFKNLFSSEVIWIKSD